MTYRNGFIDSEGLSSTLDDGLALECEHLLSAVCLEYRFHLEMNFGLPFQTPPREDLNYEHDAFCCFGLSEGPNALAPQACHLLLFYMN